MKIRHDIRDAARGQDEPGDSPAAEAEAGMEMSAKFRAGGGVVEMKV